MQFFSKKDVCFSDEALSTITYHTNNDIGVSVPVDVDCPGGKGAEPSLYRPETDALRHCGGYEPARDGVQERGTDHAEDRRAV